MSSLWPVSDIHRAFNTLASAGIMPVKTVALADHQALSKAEINALVQPGQALLMTEKDAVKYRGYANSESDWWYLPVDAHLDVPAATALLDSLVKLVK